MRVELSIGELVLAGFDPLDRYRIADALGMELGRRLDGPAVAAIVGRDCDSCEVAAPDATTGAGLRDGRASSGGRGPDAAAIADSIVRGLGGASMQPGAARTRRGAQA